MTTAQNGLAKALARSASGDVIALAELPTVDLLASLSDEQKAELAASLVPPTISAADPDKMEPEDDEEDGMTKDGKKPGCDDDAGASAGDTRVKAVAAAVANDPACQGKAAAALDMLADDDFAGLNADALIKMIGKSPAPGASADDGEAGARADMRDALAKQGNSNIDASADLGKAAGSAAASAGVWDTAYANVFPQASK